MICVYAWWNDLEKRFKIWHKFLEYENTGYFLFQFVLSTTAFSLINAPVTWYTSRAFSFIREKIRVALNEKQYFVLQKYGKLRSILLQHFIKYNHLISEEWWRITWFLNSGRPLCKKETKIFFLLNITLLHLRCNTTDVQMFYVSG